MAACKEVWFTTAFVTKQIKQIEHQSCFLHHRDCLYVFWLQLEGMHVTVDGNSPSVSCELWLRCITAKCDERDDTINDDERPDCFKYEWSANFPSFAVLTNPNWRLWNACWSRLLCSTPVLRLIGSEKPSPNAPDECSGCITLMSLGLQFTCSRIPAEIIIHRLCIIKYTETHSEQRNHTLVTSMNISVVFLQGSQHVISPRKQSQLGFLWILLIFPALEKPIRLERTHLRSYCFSCNKSQPSAYTCISFCKTFMIFWFI